MPAPHPRATLFPQGAEAYAGAVVAPWNLPLGTRLIVHGFGAEGSGLAFAWLASAFGGGEHGTKSFMYNLAELATAAEWEAAQAAAARHGLALAGVRDGLPVLEGPAVEASPALTGTPTPPSPLGARDPIAYSEKFVEALITARCRSVAAIGALLLSQGAAAGTRASTAENAARGWSETLFVDLPGEDGRLDRQVSWPFPDRDAELFRGFPPYLGEWDGTTTNKGAWEALTAYANRLLADCARTGPEALRVRVTQQPEPAGDGAYVGSLEINGVSHHATLVPVAEHDGVQRAHGSFSQQLDALKNFEDVVPETQFSPCAVGDDESDDYQVRYLCVVTPYLR